MPPLQQHIEDSLEKFIEIGADLEHKRWSKWQKYLHSKVKYTEKLGKAYYLLPADLFERWERQIHTPYSELSEQEKESDRKEARTYLPFIKQSLLEQADILRGEVEKLDRYYDNSVDIRDVLDLFKINQE